MFFIDPSSHDIGRSASSAPAAFTPSVRRGMAIEADDFRLSPTASSQRFSFHLLRGGTPLEEGYWQLRSAIFCQEQHLFEATDRDDKDGHAYPIAAIDHSAGSGSGVVGVVRILEERPRLWYGGRLGVHHDHRRHNQIGKGLIWRRSPPPTAGAAIASWPRCSSRTCASSSGCTGHRSRRWRSAVCPTT